MKGNKGYLDNLTEQRLRTSSTRFNTEEDGKTMDLQFTRILEIPDEISESIGSDKVI